jgi:hypothetical protein
MAKREQEDNQVEGISLNIPLSYDLETCFDCLLADINRKRVNGLPKLKKKQLFHRALREWYLTYMGGDLNKIHIEKKYWVESNNIVVSKESPNVSINPKFV